MEEVLGCLFLTWMVKCMFIFPIHCWVSTEGIGERLTQKPGKQGRQPLICVALISVYLLIGKIREMSFWWRFFGPLALTHGDFSMAVGTWVGREFPLGMLQVGVCTHILEGLYTARLLCCEVFPHFGWWIITAHGGGHTSLWKHRNSRLYWCQGKPGCTKFLQSSRGAATSWTMATCAKAFSNYFSSELLDN